MQTTIGWIFWDPVAVASYERLGLPGPLGYIASRAAPLGPAGPDATIAAFGSISPTGIRLAFQLMESNDLSWDQLWRARDEAVLIGLTKSQCTELCRCARMPRCFEGVLLLSFAARG